MCHLKELHAIRILSFWSNFSPHFVHISLNIYLNQDLILETLRKELGAICPMFYIGRVRAIAHEDILNYVVITAAVPVYKSY